jgi:hypothetical protein
MINNQIPENLENNLQKRPTCTKKKMKNANNLARTNVGIPLLESWTILLLQLPKRGMVAFLAKI